MGRFLVLALLAALTVAEVAAVVALVDALGGALALMVLFLDVVAGVLVMRWGARSQPPVRGWRIGAGAFIALPGLVLDLVGLVLLLPPIQTWVSGHVLRGTEAALRARGVSVVTVTDDNGVPRTTVVPGEVIPGEVVEGEDGSTTDRGGSSPQPGPDVVRGEVLGPED